MAVCVRTAARHAPSMGCFTGKLKLEPWDLVRVKRWDRLSTRHLEPSMTLA